MSEVLAKEMFDELVHDHIVSIKFHIQRKQNSVTLVSRGHLLQGLRKERKRIRQCNYRREGNNGGGSSYAPD